MDDAANSFLNERFFRPNRRKEVLTKLVKECMKDTSRISGIEKDEDASNNPDDPHALWVRTELLQRIVVGVVKRNGSLMQRGNQTHYPRAERRLLVEEHKARPSSECKDFTYSAQTDTQSLAEASTCCVKSA